MIDTWSELERHDYAKVLREREEAMERGRQRRQREQEALEWQRQQKAQLEREELWSWYAGYDVAESFDARDRARGAVAAQELGEAVKSELLAVEMDQTASETSDALDQVKPK